jgi:glycosidase
VTKVSLHIAGQEAPIPMPCVQRVRRWRFYEARVVVPRHGITYCFTLDDTLWFTKYGTYDARKAATGWWSFIFSPHDVFETPAWVADAVFYHVFPERFRNGDRSLDPPRVKPWDTLPGHHDFLGGDLVGVREALPYLQELGIDAIYLNPIFEATTNHKYNATDFYRIDPHFGDLDLFKALVAECHERGIRVILDGVFNHVGVAFAPFRDVLERGPASPYAEWFYCRSFPVRSRPRPNYVCWWDYWELPKLNLQNPEVRRYLLEVAVYWIREADIDGWRLDVPEEVPQSFWREFRAAVKAVKPEVYLVGEIWHDGRPWLRGDQFDAVMNYRFREAALNLLGGSTRDGESGLPGDGPCDARGYDERMHDLLSELPLQAVRCQFNILGSHDTARLRTLLGGDPARVRLAALLMFTAPGAPVVYYGDEVGMEGGKDPDCRRGFPWERARQDLATLAVFQSLIALRRAWPALRHGDWRTLHVGRCYAYARLLGPSEEAIAVVVNPSSTEVEVDLPLRCRRLLWGSALDLGQGALRGVLGPYDGAVLQVGFADVSDFSI